MAYIPAVGPATGAGAAGAGGVGALAAIPGLQALLLPLLLSFGPAAISKLFGGDPQQKLRDEINRLILSLPSRTNALYTQNISSPAYGQAQGTIAAGANQTANQVAAALGARGLGTTGTGAILSSLTPSLVGSQTAGLRTSAYTSAQQAAEDELKQRIAALTGTQGPSQTQKLFAGGLESFGPYLQAYLRKRFPTFSDMTVPMGTAASY